MAGAVLLSTLLQDLPQTQVQGAVDVPVTGVHHDSRKIQPGHVFVAISGATFDGLDFVPQAIERGAAAVVIEKAPLSSPKPALSPVEGFLQVPLIIVPNARSALAHLAAAFHGHPSRRLKVVGVTGTDGKTTTCNLIHAVLTAAGHPAGMVSTVSALIGDEEIDTGFHDDARSARPAGLSTAHAGLGR